MTVIVIQNHACRLSLHFKTNIKPSTATLFHIGSIRLILPKRSNSQAHKKATTIPGSMAHLGKRSFLAAFMSLFTSLASNMLRLPSLF